MKITFQKEIKKQDEITAKKILETILKNRQIKNINEFLNPTSPLKISILDFDKSFKDQIKKVILILDEIKKNNQIIVVYTDYDADGITGGAIVWETFHLLGFKVMPYVPDRKKEGYGFSITGIDNVIKEFNPALIISVDHGITKIKEVEYAKNKGIKIIITDHHLKKETIPLADAVFHIPALSGSGVGYFFAKEIFNYFKFQTTHYSLLTTYFSNDYLALASIGTIADLVPLIGPSRSIVKFGLETFPKIKRFGIKNILKQAGIEEKKITSYEVGFIIAPRINAVGRLKNAIDALRLLCTTNNKKAYELAHQIGNLNQERQDLVSRSVEEAKKMLINRYFKKTDSIKIEKALLNQKQIKTAIPKLIVLSSNHWHEGIIGLIASKIAEEFYRPTIVMTKTDGHYKGSARSIPSFHITEFLRSLKEYLIDVGGHAQAAGFTVEADKCNNFVTAVQKLSSQMIRDKDLEKVILVDIKIPISKISLEMVKELEKLEPFGVGNSRPTFLSEAVLTDAKLFGKKNEHLKIFVSEPNNHQSLELIAFNKGEIFNTLSRGQKITIIYSLEIDRWNGKERLRGKINYLS